jgi:hypothetical protein
MRPPRFRRERLGGYGKTGQHPEPIPEYAFDCHTRRGRKRGKTKRDFFRDEQGVLRPRQQGLLDEDVEGL